MKTLKNIKTTFFLSIGGIASLLYLGILLIISLCDSEAADLIAKSMFEKEREKK